MKHKILTIFVVLLMTFISLMTSSADSIEMAVSQSTVYTMADSVTVDDAFSVLVRGEDEIAMMLYAEDLPANEAVTAWWVIFNNPEACSDVCNSDDLPQNGGDLAVDAAMILADGMVVGSDGSAEFTARLAVGDTSDAYAFETQGLQDVANAEVHLVIRSHGQAIVELLDAQTGTLNGGCENGSEASGTAGPNTCTNVMASLHFAN